MWPIFWPNNGGKTNNNKAQKKSHIVFGTVAFYNFSNKRMNSTTYYRYKDTKSYDLGVIYEFLNYTIFRNQCLKFCLKY